MNRDLQIDFLRFLGLSLVIVAHIQAPFTFTQIRSFDVPLMVFVSGLSASGKYITNYWQYLWKRTKRLIVPVWLFLAFYLTAFYIVQSLVLPEPYLTGRMIGRSFLLLDESIGYVWIIRVFLLIMIVTPPIVRMSQRIKSESVFIFIVLSFLLLNQIAFQHISSMSDDLFKNGLKDILIYGIAYSIPFVLGVRLKQANYNILWLYFALFILFFVLLGFNCYEAGNNPIGVSSGYKFPPRPYFIVYGSLVSILLWTTRQWWGQIANNRFTAFVGQNTIWIYLWHMPFALIATVFMDNWIIKYVFVYGLALLLFWMQYRIVSRLENKILKKYLLG